MHEQNSADKKRIYFDLQRESKITSQNWVVKTATNYSFMLTNIKTTNKRQGHNIH
jgi:hypothetical protein